MMILPHPDSDQDLAALSVEDLIRMILCYHETHLLDLAHAITLAKRVESRHGGLAAFPTGLTALLTRLFVGLRDHQAREEHALIPLLESGDSPAADRIVSALGREHEEAQDDLERLVRLTGDYAAPEAACASWRELYDVCRKFDTDFREHLRLEDRILFPRLMQAA